jgi:hypothetical protein
LHDKIINAVREQSRSEQWRKDGGQYIPYPATWLNRADWDNEPLKIGGFARAPDNGQQDTPGSLNDALDSLFAAEEAKPKNG